MSGLSPTTHEVADLLKSLGWRASSDAQHMQLDEAIRDGRLVNSLFSAERNLRDFIKQEA